MKLILIFFIFTLTFHCCSYCLRYGICVDTLSLTAFCISCCFVASIVEAKLAVGFFLSYAEVFPWHIVWAHKCRNLVLYCVLATCMYAFWPLAVSLAVYRVYCTYYYGTFV